MIQQMQHEERNLCGICKEARMAIHFAEMDVWELWRKFLAPIERHGGIRCTSTEA